MANESVIESRPLRERPRVFRVVRAVLLIVATYSVVADIAQVVAITTGHATIALGGSDGRLPLSILPQLLQAELREGASGTLADSALSLRLLCALPNLIHAVTMVLATVYLLRVLRGIAQAQPFDPFVLTSWRRLSVALIVGGVVQSLADTAAMVYLSSRIGLLFGAGHVSEAQRAVFLGGDYETIGTNTPQWQVAVIVAGLVALALSTAFRAGARLEREADGVV